MKLTVISDLYPSNRLPNKGAFIYNLMQEMSRYHDITVVTPFRIHDLLMPKIKGGYGQERCKVLRPLFPAIGKRKILGIDPRPLRKYFIQRAVNKGLSTASEKPDLIYAHFLYNGITALPYLKQHPVPLVIASGESGYSESLKKDKGTLLDLKKHTHHFICVSEKNREGLIELGFDERKMTVIPNAVDYALFKPLDKAACKEKLGLSHNQFVVGFVGHFIHRKGPNRIIDAITQLNDPDIRLVCVGGKEGLKANSFTTTVPPLPNYQLPEIYNAFDIFVLPTLNEGHCNAIEEAKACCIPIISSLGTSVELQMDNSIGTLINPLDINAIASAIINLKENATLRDSMVNNLKNKIGEHSLKSRAERISALLENVVTTQNSFRKTETTI